MRIPCLRRLQKKNKKNKLKTNHRRIIQSKRQRKKSQIDCQNSQHNPKNLLMEKIPKLVKVKSHQHKEQRKRESNNRNKSLSQFNPL